ncbi:MAG: hypothetical protein H8E59_00050 [Actinobacteria bacterium]|nr:hypothetical protein [Actinomycetota bacterium]
MTTHEDAANEVSTDETSTTSRADHVRLRQFRRLLEDAGLDGVFGHDWASIDPETGNYTFGDIEPGRMQAIMCRLDELCLERQGERRSHRRTTEADRAARRAIAPVAAPDVPVEMTVGPHLGGQV